MNSEKQHGRISHLIPVLWVVLMAVGTVLFDQIGLPILGAIIGTVVAFIIGVWWEENHATGDNHL